MTEKNIENKNPVLTFEGGKYNINDLNSETKELIKGLQIAETQLKIYEDTFKLLSIGRNSLTNQLRENQIDSISYEFPEVIMYQFYLVVMI